MQTLAYEIGIQINLNRQDLISITTNHLKSFAEKVMVENNPYDIIPSTSIVGLFTRKYLGGEAARNLMAKLDNANG